MFFRVVGRLTARFFRSLAKFFYTVWRGSLRHPVRAFTSLVLFAVIAVVFYLTSGFGLLNGAAFGGNSAGTVSREESSPAADQFMTGLTSFDATKIWGSLAASYKQQLADRKVDQDSISQFFDEQIIQPSKSTTAKLSVKYNGYVHLQTISFPNGNTANNYLAVLSINDTAKEYAYVIVLNNKGEIISLGNDGAPDPIMEGILGRSQGQGQ